MNLAFEVYRLTPDDLERFDFVYTRKPTFAEMIEDSATMWRDRLRLICATQDECRWAFLRHSCPQHKTFLPQHAEMTDVPTVARYFCLRTEERVASLDAMGKPPRM